MAVDAMHNFDLYDEEKFCDWVVYMTTLYFYIAYTVMAYPVLLIADIHCERGFKTEGELTDNLLNA